LRELPLFAGCAREELQRILNLAKEMEVGKGNELTREGDPGDTFYVILRGTAGVTRRSEKLATLGPGSFFGETALLTGGPRTATVTADTTMTGFDAILNESRTVSRRILEGVAERTPMGSGQLFP
jgi:CRP-like cAMP-binding protein